MSNNYVQMKKPPWRYLTAALACFALVAIFLVTQTKGFSRRRDTVSAGAKKVLAAPLDDIHNATLGFEKVLAVSLPERTDRRDGLILASAVSNFDVDFIDGVHGDKVLEKTLPPGKHNNLASSSWGSWRAHLNAVAEVVHKNYSSALIMEDDLDWDIRLKSLLKDFALSHNVLAQNPDTPRFDFRNLPPVAAPTVSPYGDNWDLLWLGHCGMNLPSTGLVIHSDDSSVPEPQFLHSWMKNEMTPLAIYPHHTRVVMRQSTTPVCSLAYAISQRGARKLLYSLGLSKFDSPYDVMLRAWCQGSDGNEQHICPAVLPQLFDHYKRQGSKTGDSDISETSQENREKAETLNIRWSVRLNMEKILRGDTDYDDQYPDTLIERSIECLLGYLCYTLSLVLTLQFSRMGLALRLIVAVVRTTSKG